jgi:hypothetical protein
MTAEYAAPGGVMGTGGTFYGQGSTLGGVTFDAGPRHRSVRIRIEDRAGLPVSASVRVDDDGDGKEDRSREICGSTGEPLAVAPGASVKVLIFAGPCADGTPAAATQGTVFATFGRQ